MSDVWVDDPWDDANDWYLPGPTGELPPEYRYVVTVWSSGRSILAQVEVSAHDEAAAVRLVRRLLLPEHRGLSILAERIE